MNRSHIVSDGPCLGDDVAAQPGRSQEPTQACVHFVGFNDDRFWAAVKVFGRPHVIHRGWDRYALADVGEGDTVVFAERNEHQPLPRYNSRDVDERLYSELLGLPWVNDKA